MDQYENIDDVPESIETRVQRLERVVEVLRLELISQNKRLSLITVTIARTGGEQQREDGC